jgi:ubiquinone/menaquinone biosynthesis C-methylase UbiE
VACCRNIVSRGDRHAVRLFCEHATIPVMVCDPYEWNGRVGENWAREHVRTDRSFAGLTRVLVDRTRALSPRRLLDIGCGAGETSIAIGSQRTKTDILGIDLSQSLITVARARARSSKNIRFAVADASSWHDPAFVPDTLMSRHGVMFFDDPVRAFTNLRCASLPGAQLIFSCFRDSSENAWATEIGKLIGNRVAAVAPTAPGPFAFADKAHVTAILAAAGWEKITSEPVDWDYVAGEGSDPVGDAVAFFQKIGPAASAIAERDGDERGALLASLASLAMRNLQNGRVTFKASAWIVTAQAGCTARGET